MSAKLSKTDEHQEPFSFHSSKEVLCISLTIIVFFIESSHEPSTGHYLYCHDKSQPYSEVSAMRDEVETPVLEETQVTH